MVRRLASRRRGARDGEEREMERSERGGSFDMVKGARMECGSFSEAAKMLEGVFDRDDTAEVVEGGPSLSSSC